MSKKTKDEILDDEKSKEMVMLDSLHNSKDQLADDKEIRYYAVCVTACTFRGQYWPVGREYRGFVKPPEHFKIISSPAESEEAGNDKTGGRKQGAGAAGSGNDFKLGG